MNEKGSENFGYIISSDINHLMGAKFMFKILLDDDFDSPEKIVNGDIYVVHNMEEADSTIKTLYKLYQEEKTSEV